jgi:general stress protein 26
MDDVNSVNIEKLAKLIQGIPIAMLTTHERDGSLRSRPMATQEHDFNGQLWFFTSTRSHKAADIDADHHVNVSYTSPSGNRYVSVEGIARLTVDRVIAEELWFPLLNTWFPKGLDDPDLALLRVTPTRAEYWDCPAHGVVEVLTFIETIYRADSQEHASMALH